jgi:hypothetical protein
MLQAWISSDSYLWHLVYGWLTFSCSYSYEASDADKKVFELLPEGPNAQEFPHLARWYKHIAAVNGLTAK